MRVPNLVLTIIAIIGTASIDASAGIITSGEIREFDADGDTFADDLSVDRVTFNVTAGTTVNFDILAWEISLDHHGSAYLGTDLNSDGEITTSDIHILLFDSGNNLLVSNNDGPLGGDGSISSRDSYMTYGFATAGTYFLSIGQLVVVLVQRELEFGSIGVSELKW